MNSYLKLYLKLFCQIILFLFIVTIVSTIVNFANSGESNVLIIGFKFIFSEGIIFSLILTSILCTTHIISVKSISSDVSVDNIGVNHNKTIELPVEYEKAYKLCKTSIKTIKKCEVFYEDYNKGNINALTGRGWKVFGDLIYIKLEKINDNNVKIMINCKPGMKTKIIDFGKNFKNLTSIKDFLENNYSTDDISNIKIIPERSPLKFF